MILSRIVQNQSAWAITHLESGLNNLFGVRMTTSGNPLGYIERVHYSNAIVAVDEVDDSYPNQFDPIIDEVSVPFKLMRVGSITEDIGYIQLFANQGLPSTITICPLLNNPDKPWNVDYSFLPMWTQNINHIPPGGTGGNGLSINDQVFKVKNPFNSRIEVSTTWKGQIGSNIYMELININGQIFWAEEYLTPSDNYTIPTEGLQNGCYLLRIRHSKGVASFKLIKN